MGEITLELHLVFEIPESGLTINGLIGGLKQAVGQIHGAILESDESHGRAFDRGDDAQ